MRERFKIACESLFKYIYPGTFYLSRIFFLVVVCFERNNRIISLELSYYKIESYTIIIVEDC